MSGSKPPESIGGEIPVGESEVRAQETVLSARLGCFGPNAVQSSPHAALILSGTRDRLTEKMFTKDSGLSLLGVSLDYEKIVALSDSDFAALYLEGMNDYMEKEGWWKEGNIPHCKECSSEIKGPSQLRRYEGISMDAECFSKFYKKEGDSEKDETMKRYWERVAKLRF